MSAMTELGYYEEQNFRWLSKYLPRAESRYKKSEGDRWMARQFPQDDP